MHPLPPSAFNECDPLYRKEVEAWVNHGALPETSFLTAVLRGDLKAAYRNSNRQQMSLLVGLVRFIDRVEERCWGSGEAVANWVMDGGLAGKTKKLNEYEQATMKPPRSPTPRIPKGKP